MNKLTYLQINLISDNEWAYKVYTQFLLFLRLK